MQEIFLNKIKSVNKLSWILWSFFLLQLFNWASYKIDMAYDHEAVVRKALDISTKNSLNIDSIWLDCSMLKDKSKHKEFKQIKENNYYVDTVLFNCFNQLETQYKSNLKKRMNHIEGSTMINSVFETVPIINIKVRKVFYRQFLQIAFIYIMFQLIFNFRSMRSVLNFEKTKNTSKEDFSKVKLNLEHEKPNLFKVIKWGIIMPGILSLTYIFYDTYIVNFKKLFAYGMTKSFDQILKYQIGITSTLMLVMIISLIVVIRQSLKLKRETISHILEN